jgi:hypothetical protein
MGALVRAGIDRCLDRHRDQSLKGDTPARAESDMRRAARPCATSGGVRAAVRCRANNGVAGTGGGGGIGGAGARRVPGLPGDLEYRGPRVAASPAKLNIHAVPSRLWLGGVVSPVRDLRLIPRLADLVRLARRPGRPLLSGVDGLASYVMAFGRALREELDTGRRGRPPYRLPKGVLLGQVIKRCSGRRLVEVVRHADCWGSLGQIGRVWLRTGTGRPITTSSLERLNATFRAALCPLVRLGRALVRGEGVLTGWMYLVGCAYL